MYHYFVFHLCMLECYLLIFVDCLSLNVVFVAVVFTFTSLTHYTIEWVSGRVIAL